jgi:hypothetical protein
MTLTILDSGAGAAAQEEAINASAKMSPLSPLEGIFYRVSPSRCLFSDTYEAKKLPGVPFRKSFKNKILRGYLQNANFG